MIALVAYTMLFATHVYADRPHERGPRHGVPLDRPVCPAHRHDQGAEYQSIADELKKHLSQELEHAMTLAEQIDFLGGVPSVDVPKVPVETDSAAALRLDLELEENQLERYRERVTQAKELGLLDVAEALRPLLEQTQDHVRELRAALGK